MVFGVHLVVLCAALQENHMEEAVASAAGIFPELAAAMARDGTNATLLAEAQQLKRRGNASAVRCSGGC